MKTDADFDTRFYDLIRKYYELTKKVQLLGLVSSALNPRLMNI